MHATRHYDKMYLTHVLFMMQSKTGWALNPVQCMRMVGASPFQLCDAK
jgi:hypothetical protein